MVLRLLPRIHDDEQHEIKQHDTTYATDHQSQFCFFIKVRDRAHLQESGGESLKWNGATSFPRLYKFIFQIHAPHSSFKNQLPVCMKAHEVKTAQFDNFNIDCMLSNQKGSKFCSSEWRQSFRCNLGVEGHLPYGRTSKLPKTRHVLLRGILPMNLVRFLTSQSRIMTFKSIKL